MSQSAHRDGSNPKTSTEIAALSSITSKLLDAPVSESTRGVMVAHGMPYDEQATISLVFEMALAPELPILAAAPQQERALWTDWGLRLEMCHQSSSFHSKGLSRGDLDLLAESAEIARRIQQCVDQDTYSMLSQAFAREIGQHADEFEEVSRLAAEARRRIAA
jgi:hypothetical protein